MKAEQTIAFDRACGLLDKALSGSFRRDIIADLSQSRTLGKALTGLRASMESHAWASPAQRIDLERLVAGYDRRTRAEGLHAMHDWDGKAGHINDDSIPVDVLNFIIRQRGDDPVDATVVAILVDYYFLYLLALLSLRLWDEGPADEHLDRLQHLVEHLQGPHGSGQLFTADAETLILIATSHFELEERGYHLLLERARTLNAAHRVRIAMGHATSMGCHLRFGFEATYARDTVVMRDDNVADYPWLCFAMATLMDAYERGEREAALVEALLNGLSADARAFVGEAPKSLASCADERERFRERFFAHRQELLDRFEGFRPSERVYSPLSLFFNFAQNAMKGTVADALLRGRPWALTFNDLLTSAARGTGDDSQEALATTLMAYARAAPDRIRGRLMPVIVYDPQAGRQAFGVTMRRLRE